MALIALACFFLLASGQTWLTVFDGGANGNDQANALSVDGEGNIYVSGVASRSDYAAAGTAKLDPNGQRIWLKNYDPYPGYEQQGRCIAVDGSSCSFVLAGSKDSTNTWCFATVKYSPGGDEVWSARYSDSAHHSDFPYGLGLTSDGRCCVVGKSSRSSADSDFLTICYSGAGGTAWLRRYGDPSGRLDRALAIVTDQLGAAYVTGYATTDSGMQVAVVKYDSSGVQEYLTLFNPNLEHAAGNAIAVDATGSVYVGGYQGPHYTKFLTMKLNSSGDTLWTRVYFRGACVALAADDSSYVYCVGTDNQTGNTPDIVTLKYDADGNLLWDARYDGFDQLDDWGYDVALGPDGSVYACGSSQSAENGTECILIKYDFWGDTVWTARIPGHDRYGSVFNAVEVDNDGNIIVAGCICSDGTGKDYIIAKYSPSGPGIEERGIPKSFSGHAVTVVPSVVSRRCVFSVAQSGTASGFRVLDIGGRAVRELELPSGETSVAWNANDESGRPVPNGVYFAVAETPTSCTAVKFLIQR